MRVEDYAKYINLLHDLALVEDDLRDTIKNGKHDAFVFAQQVLYERFGV